MGRPLHLDPERFFPSDPKVRSIAASLFGAVEALPILGPHGHTDPRWFAGNEPFKDAVSLLSALDDPTLFPPPIRENVSLRAAILEAVA